MEGEPEVEAGAAPQGAGPSSGEKRDEVVA